MTTRTVPPDTLVITKGREWLDHILRRRFVWFCMYYRPKAPRHAHMPSSEAIWATLMDLDNHVLNPLQDVGILPKWEWQGNPPRSATDNGGFADDYLAECLEPADLARIQPLKS